MPGLLREEDEGSEHGGKVLLRDMIKSSTKRDTTYDFGNKKKEIANSVSE